MSGDSVSALPFGGPSEFGPSHDALSSDAAPATLRPPGTSAERAPAGVGFAVEWAVLLGALACVGFVIAWALYGAHRAVGAAERDRLGVQARVVDENVAQQLDGVARALASVRDEFVVTQPTSVSTLMSARLKALTDASPGVRSMVLLDAEGNVAATSVDTVLGRDYSDRDFFRAARRARDRTALHVATPYQTSLGNYNVVFARSAVAPNGAFLGVVAAALEPEYYEVLMRSVLYAPDMRVSLGYGDGKVFVTMPREPPGIDAAAAAAGDTRLTATRDLSPPDLHMDRPLLIAVSRAQTDVYGAWRRQAIEYAGFFAVLCAVAVFGLRRGHARRLAYRRLEAAAEGERLASAQQLELALQSGELGLWSWDLASDRFSIHRTARLHLGFSIEELDAPENEFRRRVHHGDMKILLAAVEAHFRGELPALDAEFRAQHKNGSWIWLHARGKIVERDAYGAPVRMAGTHMDVTERKRNEERIERTGAMLARTEQLADIGGWEIELKTMRIVWTEQVFRIHELEPGQMPELAQSLGFYAPEAQPLIEAAIAAGATDGTPWDLELPFFTARGNPRWVRTQGVAVLENGKPVRLLGAFQDITERKRTAIELQRVNEQLQRLSTTDPLTEVGNRRLFDQTLRTEWARASRRGEAVGLLMIDIDHFKEYNDHYGHPAGDACLRQVAKLVGDAVRRGGELVARYGGEEFAVLLPGADLHDTRVAAGRCVQLLDNAKVEHRASPTSAWLTISVGVASQLATAGTDGSGLIDIADAALYRAKRCGRGRIEF